MKRALSWARNHQQKRLPGCNLALIVATGFLPVPVVMPAKLRGRKETGRFS